MEGFALLALGPRVIFLVRFCPILLNKLIKVLEAIIAELVVGHWENTFQEHLLVWTRIADILSWEGVSLKIIS